jgi:hypothetical protein
MQTKNSRRFIVDVDETLRIVLEQEDTDGDFQVRLSRPLSHDYSSFDGVTLISSLD